MKVKKQYLMSRQEINQHQIIEQLFKNFDADGSGALDLGELQELFRENRINLDKDVIQKMFQGNSFTLEKFKAINNSSEGLQKFKETLEPHLDRIFQEIVQDYKDKKERAIRRKENKQQGIEESSDSDSVRALLIEDDGRSIYLPRTFESMMEVFGINLKKKQLVAKFKERKRMLEKMIKGSKDYTPEEIIACQNEGHAVMVEIIGHMAHTDSNIVNEHNQLFMSILTRIKHENQKIKMTECLADTFRGRVSSMKNDLIDKEMAMAK